MDNSSSTNVSRTRIRGASIFLIKSSGILGCFVYIYIYILLLFGALCNFEVIMRMKLVNRRISSNIGWNIGLISFIFVTSFYYNNPPEIFSRRINENPLIEFNEFLNTSLYILFVKSIKLSTLFHKIIESLEN